MSLSKIMREIEQNSIIGFCRVCNDDVEYDSIKEIGLHHKNGCYWSGYELENCSVKYDLNKILYIILTASKPKRYVYAFVMLSNPLIRFSDVDPQTIDNYYEDLLDCKQLHEYKLFEKLRRKSYDDPCWYPMTCW